MDVIHIVGAGGIGCAMAYSLCRSGARVVCVERCADKIAWGKKNGVQVNRLRPFPADFVSFASWSPPVDGLVLLCTKGPANAEVLTRLPRSTCVVPIQNGIDPQLTHRSPLVEGIASFVSECIPGRTQTRITRRGSLHLGLHGTPTESLSQVARHLAALLRGGPFRVALVADILPYKHTKLLYNAAIGPLASAAGLDNGELLRVPRLRELFFRLLRENYGILRHAGLPLGTVGPLAPGTVAAILSRPWLAHLLAWAFYPSLAGTYCSMARDLPRGPTEIDLYNGRLIELAGHYPCPLNRAVYALITTMEREQLPPALQRIDELERLYRQETELTARMESK